MTTDNLKQQLLQLHTALSGGAPLDQEMVALLRVLDADIRSTLAQVQPGDPVQIAPASGEGLTSRAQEISARFAAQHPHLEPVLRELTDTLQRIGI